MKKTLFLLALAAQIAVGQSNYYVDPSGSDQNDGLGQGLDHAWRTAYKVSNTSFSPGDHIYFKRGAVFEDQLYITSSGSAGNVIYFGAYGTGANPVICQAWHPGNWSGSGPVYTTSIGGNPRLLTVNGVPVPSATSSGNVNGAYPSGSDGKGVWFYSGGTLWVYSASGQPNNVEGAMYGGGTPLVINSHSYITLENLNFRGHSPVSQLDYTSYITFNYCRFSLGVYSIKFGTGESGTETGTGQNDHITLWRDTLDTDDKINYPVDMSASIYGGYSGDWLGGGDNIMAWGADYVSITECVFRGWRHQGINLFPVGGMTTSHWTVHNNEFAGTNDYCYPLGPHEPAWRGMGYCQYNSFKYNYIHGCTNSIQFCGSYSDFCFNFIDTVRINDYWPEPMPGLALSNSDGSYCAYNRFNNNVFRTGDGAAISVAVGSTVFGNEVKNNISYNMGINRRGLRYPTNQMLYTDLGISAIEGGSLPSMNSVFQNNAIYKPSASNTVLWLQYPHDDDHIPVSSWNGDSRGGNTVSGNVSGNPYLNANGSLSASSTEEINHGKAWNTGIGVTGSPTVDFFGNTVTNTDNVIDIGIQEYGGAGADTIAVVSTSAATNVATYTATLNGTIDAQSTSTTPRFVWGTSTGNYTDSTYASPNPVTGTTSTAISYNAGGFLASTQYFYRARGYNNAGAAQGTEQNFTTSAGDNTRPLEYADVTAGPLRDQSSISAQLSASSNADRMIIAWVIGYHGSGFPAVSSITCGGNAMTAIGSQLNPYGVVGVRAYYRLAPATGNNTVSVTMASAPTDLSLIVSSWYQVNQTTPIGGGQGSSGVGSQMTLTWTTQSGDVVVDCGVPGWASTFSGLSSGQTEICHIDGTGYINDPMHTQKPNTSTSTTLTQDSPNGNGYAYYGFVIHKNDATPPAPSPSKRVIILLHR